MGHQILVQTEALKRPAVQQPVREGTGARKTASIEDIVSCWTRYLLDGKYRGLPELMDFLYGNYFFTPMQVPEELVALGEILQELRPERVLEIGTGNGGTLFYLTRLASRRASIVSVDLPEGKFSGGYSTRRQLFYERFGGRKKRLRLIRGNSHLPWMSTRVENAFGGKPIDLLFIDGDRRYAGVKEDFETFGPMVRKGGLIAFHDIVEGNPEIVGGAPRFWQEVKSRYRHSEIIKNPFQDGYGIGLLYVD